MRKTLTLATRAVLGVLVVAALVAAAGCATKASALSQDDSGGKITVKQGEEVKVELEGNPSTGFSWVVVNDADGILKQIGEPAIEETKASGSKTIVGRAQMQVFTFEATKSGSATLRMEYKRSWETTVPPEKTFSIAVTAE